MTHHWSAEARSHLYGDNITWGCVVRRKMVFAYQVQGTCVQ